MEAATTTNRPEVLDKALLRPGRFDRRIIVEKPDLKGRVDILRVHAKDVLMDESVDFEEIALATSGAVGADLANMINEAAIMAVRSGRRAVNQKDLFEAVEVVIAGKEKKDRILGKEEKRIVAYHGAGSKDYHRATYDGISWICHAGSGRREISDEQSRDTHSDHNIIWRQGCGRISV